jgi:hypothetical protein
MAKRIAKIKQKKMSVMCCAPNVNMAGCGGAFYGLGFIGALIYFITTAPTFWMALLGFFKAIVWPAFLVFGLMKYIGL